MGINKTDAPRNINGDFFFYNINGDDDEKEIYMLNLFPNEK